MANPGSSDSDTVTALSALYQSEISANIGELQATSAIVLGLLAYLATTIFFFDDVATRVLPLLPLGVAFACAYQMLRAAVVVRRAALARAYERRLAEIVGFKTEFDNAKLGSAFYGSLDDINVILKKPRKSGWQFKALVAVIAYLGLYGLSILYTVLVLAERWSRHGTWPSLVWTLGYIIIWGGLLTAAAFLFKPEEPAALANSPQSP
jgi:hypothetical protein